MSYLVLEPNFDFFQNSELELIISSHEKTLIEKESQLEEMTRKFRELKRIQDMIHNISAGKLV